MDEAKRREYDLKTQDADDMTQGAQGMHRATPPPWFWEFQNMFANFSSRFHEYRESGAAESTDNDDNEVDDWEEEYHFRPQARATKAAEGQARRAARDAARRQAQEAENRKVFEEEERRAAKEAAARAAADDKRRRKAEEEAFQARVWARAGAVTDEEVRESCLHSEQCTKTVERRKVKCDGCAVKRGIVAFHCPYCAATLCTVCVSDFARVRKQRREAEGDKTV